MCAYLSRLFQPGFQSADAILCRHGALYLNEKGASTVSWSTGPFVNVQPIGQDWKRKRDHIWHALCESEIFFCIITNYQATGHCMVT